MIKRVYQLHFYLTSTKEDKVNELANKIKFKMTKNDYGYKPYSAVAKNTSGLNFSYFNLNINLLDKDGVIIESTSASVNNFSEGAKARFEFSTDKSFKKIDIKTIEWSEADE